MGSFQKPCLYNSHFTLNSLKKSLFSISTGGHLCLDKMLPLPLLSILCCLALQVKIPTNTMLKTRFSTEILPRVESIAAEKRECPLKGVLLIPTLDQGKCSKSSFSIQWAGCSGHTHHSSVCSLCFCCQMENFLPALLKPKAVIILFVSGGFWLVFLSYEVSPRPPWCSNNTEVCSKFLLLRK